MTDLFEEDIAHTIAICTKKENQPSCQGLKEHLASDAKIIHRIIGWSVKGGGYHFYVILRVGEDVQQTSERWDLPGIWNCLPVTQGGPINRLRHILECEQLQEELLALDPPLVVQPLARTINHPKVSPSQSIKRRRPEGDLVGGTDDGPRKRQACSDVEEGELPLVKEAPIPKAAVLTRELEKANVELDSLSQAYTESRKREEHLTAEVRPRTEPQRMIQGASTITVQDPFEEDAAHSISICTLKFTQPSCEGLKEHLASDAKIIRRIIGWSKKGDGTNFFVILRQGEDARETSERWNKPGIWHCLPLTQDPMKNRLRHILACERLEGEFLASASLENQPLASTTFYSTTLAPQSIKRERLEGDLKDDGDSRPRKRQAYTDAEEGNLPEVPAAPIPEDGSPSQELARAKVMLDYLSQELTESRKRERDLRAEAQRKAIAFKTLPGRPAQEMNPLYHQNLPGAPFTDNGMSLREPDSFGSGTNPAKSSEGAVPKEKEHPLLPVVPELGLAFNEWCDGNPGEFTANGRAEKSLNAITAAPRRRLPTARDESEDCGPISGLSAPMVIREASTNSHVNREDHERAKKDLDPRMESLDNPTREAVASSQHEIPKSHEVVPTDLANSFLLVGKRTLSQSSAQLVLEVLDAFKLATDVAVLLHERLATTV